MTNLMIEAIFACLRALDRDRFESRGMLLEPTKCWKDPIDPNYCRLSAVFYFEKLQMISGECYTKVSEMIGYILRVNG